MSRYLVYFGVIFVKVRNEMLSYFVLFLLIFTENNKTSKA